MRIDRLGEWAAILREVPEPADLARRLDASGLPGLIEAVACYDTVGVYFDSGFSLDALNHLVDTLASHAPSSEAGVHHTIPVCYEMGEDLAEVATRLEKTDEQVIALHLGVDYTCYAVGFCPGFPYLGYLPDELAGVPRRSEPRTRIEPGSVAITGRQTGVYPLPRPGGWAILGRTPLVLVDVEERYFPIQAGDRVRFVPIGRDEFAARRGERL